MQLLESLEILPGEYFSSIRVLEMVLVTYKDLKFALFWSSPWISWALQMKKFPAGEIRTFPKILVIINFGHCHGNLAW